MRVLITGGAGFLGSSLARALTARGSLTGPEGREEAIDDLVLFDQTLATGAPAGATVVSGDIRDPAVLDEVFRKDFDSIFHLAAVVSAASEADFDLGLTVNFDGTRGLMERARRQQRPPLVVFTSSIAVFGGELPEVIRDDTPATPQGSYGAQKAMCELLLNDATRKGFLDVRCLRLPTIVVRPGKPNKAASSFASSIIREPLAGKAAVCPVDPGVGMWILSPRQAVESFMHAHELNGAALGSNRVLNLPGVTATVQEMVAALGRAGGDTGLVRWERDEGINRLVSSWPGRFKPQRALALGFESDNNIDDIVRAYQEDWGNQSND